MTAQEESKALVRRLVEIVNARDVEALEEGRQRPDRPGGATLDWALPRLVP